MLGVCSPPASPSNSTQNSTEACSYITASARPHTLSAAAAASTAPVPRIQLQQTAPRSSSSSSSSHRPVKHGSNNVLTAYSTLARALSRLVCTATSLEEADSLSFLRRAKSRSSTYRVSESLVRQQQEAVRQQSGLGSEGCKSHRRGFRDRRCFAAHRRHWLCRLWAAACACKRQLPQQAKLV